MKAVSGVWWDQTYGIRTVPKLCRIVGLAAPNVLGVYSKLLPLPDRLFDTEYTGRCPQIDFQENTLERRTGLGVVPTGEHA